MNDKSKDKLQGADQDQTLIRRKIDAIKNGNKLLGGQEGKHEWSYIKPKVQKFENYDTKKKYMSENKNYRNFLSDNFKQLKTDSYARLEPLNLKVPELLKYCDQRVGYREFIHNDIVKKTKEHKRVGSMVDLKVWKKKSPVKDKRHALQTYQSIQQFESANCSISPRSDTDGNEQEQILFPHIWVNKFKFKNSH